MKIYPEKKIHKNISKVLGVGLFTVFIIILTALIFYLLNKNSTLLSHIGFYWLILIPLLRLTAVFGGYYRAKQIKYAFTALISALILTVLFVIGL